MLQIKKLRADLVIDFAAAELKKYLRMMMPEEKVVDILYAPDATDGFRLGLLEDFDLPCEAEDALVDDVVHIDTGENGGILAGSNPRSVLFAVYRYLKLNWLTISPISTVRIGRWSGIISKRSPRRLTTISCAERSAKTPKRAPCMIPTGLSLFPM